MAAPRKYKIERKGVIRFVLLRDDYQIGSKLVWGSGPRWTVLEVSNV